ncbi:MAG TPA: DinB family protein, partial [Acidobacteriota bacterium]|nr:DinB family protein [Acidobacteriota bacterium]
KLRAQVLVSKINDQWSIQEHAGHLLDLEPLSLVRLDDYAAGRSILVAADITNRKTHEAGHNLKPLQSILSSFRLERERLVGKLESLDEGFIQRTAVHPRLNIPMRVIDFALFMAEHDDHHLARITALIRNMA